MPLFCGPLLKFAFSEEDGQLHLLEDGQLQLLADGQLQLLLTFGTVVHVNHFEVLTD
jgi:hypothetical protein